MTDRSVAGIVAPEKRTHGRVVAVRLNDRSVAQGDHHFPEEREVVRPHRLWRIERLAAVMRPGEEHLGRHLAIAIARVKIRRDVEPSFAFDGQRIERNARMIMGTDDDRRRLIPCRAAIGGVKREEPIGALWDETWDLRDAEEYRLAVRQERDLRIAAVVKAELVTTPGRAAVA
jgi:hypothetical protein